ncbi:uncharacterized protein LOC101857517, partial [Aplysia californica]|uniref:Uncharacterized protein LOC101857517 n=1 Tax=Aplysia californica TaxID=6500 RepID=A0ABM1W0R8_APLCA
ACIDLKAAAIFTIVAACVFLLHHLGKCDHPLLSKQTDPSHLLSNLEEVKTSDADGITGAPVPAPVTEANNATAQVELSPPVLVAQTDPPIAITDFPLLHVFEPPVGPRWMGLPLPLCPHESCYGRCDEKGNSAADYITARGLDRRDRPPSCMCDAQCHVIGDCCRDAFSVCRGAKSPSLVLQTTVSPRLPPLWDSRLGLQNHALFYNLYGSCVATTFRLGAEIENLWMWLVSRCPDNFHDVTMDNIRGQCENGPQRKVFSHPVSIKWSQTLHFKNIFCAICHGINFRDLMFWSVEVNCPLPISPDMPFSVKDFLDILGGFRDCQNYQFPRIPDFAIPRHCKAVSHPRHCSLQDHDVNNLNTIPNPPEVDNDASFDVYAHARQLCHAYSSRVSIGGRGYENPHCFICNNGSVEDVPERYLCGFQMFSAIHLAPLFNLTALLDFVDGNLQVETVGDPRKHVLRPSNYCDIDDPINVFLSSCLPRTCLPWDKKEVFANSTDREKQCALISYLYTGPSPLALSNTTSRGRPVLWVAITFRSVSVSLVDMFQRLQESFSHVTQHFSTVRPPSPEFSSMCSEHGHDVGEGHVTLRVAVTQEEHLSTTMYALAEATSSMDLPPFSQVLGNFEVSNFVSEPDVCSGDTVVFRDVPVVELYLKTYAFVEEINCYFDVEQVGFRVTYDPRNEVRTSVKASTLVLCVTEEMMAACPAMVIEGRENPYADVSFIITPDVPVNELPRIPPTVNGLTNNTNDTQGVSGNMQRPANRPINQPFLTVNAFTSLKQISAKKSKEILDFHTVCFSASTLGLVLSLACDVRANWATIGAPMLRYVNKLAVSLLMILHLVAVRGNDVEAVAMGASSHFLWVFWSLSSFTLALSQHRVPHMTDNKRGRFGVVKVVTALFLISLSVVVVCLAVDLEEESDDQIDYSHLSDHVFWMKTKMAGYTAMIGLNGLVLLGALGLSFVAFVKGWRSAGLQPSVKITTDYPNLGNGSVVALSTVITQGSEIRGTEKGKEVKEDLKNGSSIGHDKKSTYVAENMYSTLD